MKNRMGGTYVILDSTTFEPYGDSNDLGTLIVFLQNTTDGRTFSQKFPNFPKSKFDSWKSRGFDARTYFFEIEDEEHSEEELDEENDS